MLRQRTAELGRGDHESARELDLVKHRVVTESVVEWLGIWGSGSGLGGTSRSWRSPEPIPEWGASGGFPDGSEASWTRSRRLADCPRGPLAQLAEQRTFNPRVVGSSPTGPTTSTQLEEGFRRANASRQRVQPLQNPSAARGSAGLDHAACHAVCVAIEMMFAPHPGHSASCESAVEEPTAAEVPRWLIAWAPSSTDPVAPSPLSAFFTRHAVAHDRYIIDTWEMKFQGTLAD